MPEHANGLVRYEYNNRYNKARSVWAVRYTDIFACIRGNRQHLRKFRHVLNNQCKKINCEFLYDNAYLYINIICFLLFFRLTYY